MAVQAVDSLEVCTGVVARACEPQRELRRIDLPRHVHQAVVCALWGRTCVKSAGITPCATSTGRNDLAARRKTLMPMGSQPSAPALNHTSISACACNPHIAFCVAQVEQWV